MLELRAIGQRQIRKEDLRLLTGVGKFSDDFHASGQCYAAMVRSPYAHARILSIDAARVRTMNGVLAVFTGEDCKAAGFKPIPHDPLPKTKHDMKLTAPGGGAFFFGPHMLLPADKARHVGEAVAMVVAETPALAMEAADSVRVDYEELPFVLDSEQAMAPGAAAVWDEAPENILIDTHFGDAAATERAFAAAEHIVDADFVIGRVTGVPMEPRAALAEYDVETGRYTLHAGSGGAVRQKNEIATVLGISPASLRVFSYDVGGNFGTRNRVFVEFALSLWAAEKLRCSVKYTATRSEAFLTDYQGRDLISKAALALDKDGRILAMRATNISNAGAHCVSLSPLSKGAGLITGTYDVPVASLRALSVFTNTMPTQAYRSSGRPEVTFVIERLMDMAAHRFGFDRVELRRKNLIAPEMMPYRNATGMIYDSGRYEENMDAAMALADCAGYEKRRREAADRGKLLGLGIANYVESSIGAPKEQTQIQVHAIGRVDVVIGTQAAGQGHETSFSQVVSDLLCVPVDAIRIITGDTDVVKAGGGTHSGRSLRHAATVFTRGADDLIAKGKRIAALVLDVAPDRVDFADGEFSSRDANRKFDFFELAAEAERLALPPELSDGLFVVTDNEMHDPVFPNGCAVCEVEIDPQTGALALVRYASADDVGRCVNPLIVDGQTHGGIVQGVGQALWEHVALDGASGQLLSGSFMDYGMPRADMLPSFQTQIVEVLSPTNPLGIKAGGEGGTTGAPAAIISAVVDALKPYGVQDIEMPATPQRIWQAIQSASRPRPLADPPSS